MPNIYQYFVEGQDEEKLINVLKTDMQLIVPGKVQKFNVVQEKFTPPRLLTLKPGTTVILVFDTDTGNLSILKENISILQRCKNIKAVWCVTQVRNLEDELKRSCKIKQIKELLDSKSNSEYKHDLIIEKRLSHKLEKHHFNFQKFWCTQDENEFCTIKNDADKVKIKNSLSK